MDARSEGTGRVRVELLGPLRVTVDGEVVEVRGPKRRAVLALLAFAEGRTVAIGHLVDALWPAEAPDSARQALHTHVFRLRSALGAAAFRLETGQDGYRLDLGPDELDLTQARALLAAARADPPGVEQLRQAHALWRGPVLADLTDVEPIATTVHECARLQREVTDALVVAAVAAGQAGTVLGLAAQSVAADPLREPAVLALMRALAASGQSPDALRVGRQYRRRLTEETGLDPSPALDELEREVAGGAAGPGSAPDTLPARPATRLIGRDAEVGALHRILATERLVTVVGPGGVGKTRLVLEMAQGSETVAVLLLAPITEPAAVAHALAAALNLTVQGGDVLASCAALIGDRPGLLVIDNCEHLLDAVRDAAATLLGACPNLNVLATSREPLGLVAEHTWRLGPLPLPRIGQNLSGQELADVASVAVFLDRAARVRPGAVDLATVADIVRLLDGMPLAIELAAGRLSTFALPDLRDRLDRSLDLLAGGSTSGDARHRTLRATIEWSHQLLTADEQRLFRHLAVFPDGVGLATAESVATGLDLSADFGSVLARLVDASMIEAVLGVPARYRILETLRAFGLDRLAATGEMEAAQDRLVRWAVELTAWIDAAAQTDREPDADAALRRESANLRAAWRAARDRGLLDEAAAIVTALFDTVANRDLIELRGWALELADDPALTDRPLAAAVLGTAGYAAYADADQPRAGRLARAGLDLAATADAAALCRHTLAVTALARGAYREVVEHCLAHGDDPDPRHGLRGLAALAMAYSGDIDSARGHNERWLTEASSPTAQGWATYYAGEIENAAGRGDTAERHYERALALGRKTGATFLVGVATVGLHSLRAASGRVDEALAGYREVINYFAHTGNWTHLWTTLRNLAALLERLGDYRTATLLHAAADQAPDAPPVNRPAAPAVPVPGRAALLDLARRAIERHLTGPDATAPRRGSSSVT